MKLIYTRITQRIAALAFFALSVGWLSGCNLIKEDTSDCLRGLYLRFLYTLNVDERDKFSEQVTSLDIFAYNLSDGSLVRHSRISTSSLDANNGTTFMLPQGAYRIVAWGNYDQQCHTIASQNNCNSMLLQLKTTTGDIVGTQSLFHAITEATLEAGQQAREVMYMTKNTNLIRLILEDEQGGQVDPSLFAVTMTGKNGIYNYDNSLEAGCEAFPLNYINWTEQLSDGCAVANFNVYRLFDDGCDGLNLKITAKGTPDKLLYDLPLSPSIILTNPSINTTLDLDRQDVYTLRYVVRAVGGAWTLVAIHINGWELVLQQGQI